jgi:energy-coupling factor transporter ATP-binding protein EcfA2
VERIIVVGPSGSGKSTVAARLAGLLDAPHVELWNGNRETLRDIFARDSLLPFAWRNHHAYAERYEPLQARGPMDGVTWLRFRSRSDARRWLDHLGATGTARGAGLSPRGFGARDRAGDGSPARRSTR